MVRETISALIYQHPCRSVLDQDAATGELLLAAPVCSPLCCNANMQLSEENTKKERLISKQHWILTTLKLFSWLVSPPMSGLGGLSSINGEIFRNDLWRHHPYQWSLGRGQTKNTILKVLERSQLRGPKGGVCSANMHEVTRQTVSMDNHLAHVQSLCISKLKIGR